MPCRGGDPPSGLASGVHLDLGCPPDDGSNSLCLPLGHHGCAGWGCCQGALGLGTEQPQPCPPRSRVRNQGKGRPGGAPMPQ